MTPSGTKRRRLMGAFAGAIGLGLAGAPGLPAVAAPSAPRRIVVLDWGLTEVVLSLGVTPTGIARPPWYRALDGVPALPDTVVDTGLLFQPNFEVLQSLAPELIVVTPWHASLRPHLERIAPVLSVSMSAANAGAYPMARAATMRLAAVLDRAPQGSALIDHVEQSLRAAAGRLAGAPDRLGPVYVLRPIDAAHFTVYGPRSLFGGVLEGLGVENAWDGGADAQGGAQIDIAALAARPDARIVTLGTPPSLAASLARSPLWQALPQTSPTRLLPLPAFPAFGGLLTAARFAEALATAHGAARGPSPIAMRATVSSPRRFGATA